MGSFFEPTPLTWEDIGDAGLQGGVYGTQPRFVTIKGPCGATHTMSIRQSRALVGWLIPVIEKAHDEDKARAAQNAPHVEYENHSPTKDVAPPSTDLRWRVKTPDGWSERRPRLAGETEWLA